jgi:hypothetical protein
MYRLNATWNFWGEGIDPVNDSTIIGRDPERVLFLTPYAYEPIEITDDNCYAALNQGYYHAESQDEIDSCGVILSNLSSDSSDFFAISTDLLHGEAFILDSTGVELGYLETRMIQFSFEPDTIGAYYDTLLVTITDKNDHESWRRLPLTGYCGPLTVWKEESILPISPNTCCFPDPFNDQTIIHYILTNPQKVTLKIFDACGRLIIVQELGQKNTGEQLQIFQAKGLPNGTYIYEIETKESPPNSLCGTLHIIK